MEDRITVFVDGNDTLAIGDSNSTVKISRKDLIVGAYKYSCEIIGHLKDLFNLKRDQDVIVTSEAQSLIAEICEANRVLF